MWCGGRSSPWIMSEPTVQMGEHDMRRQQFELVKPECGCWVQMRQFHQDYHIIVCVKFRKETNLSRLVCSQRRGKVNPVLIKLSMWTRREATANTLGDCNETGERATCCGCWARSSGSG